MAGGNNAPAAEDTPLLVCRVCTSEVGGAHKPNCRAVVSNGFNPRAKNVRHLDK
jgi:hypothetical protein